MALLNIEMLFEHIRLGRGDMAVEGLEVQPTDIVAADMFAAIPGRLLRQHLRHR